MLLLGSLLSCGHSNSFGVRPRTSETLTMFTIITRTVYLQNLRISAIFLLNNRPVHTIRYMFSIHYDTNH